jgi:hypothetical protein
VVNKPVYDWSCEVNVGKADYGPSGYGRLKVFLQIGHKTGRSIVAASNPNAALNFDERAAWLMGEVSAPSALGIKPKLSFERRAAGRSPQHFELFLEARPFGSEAQTFGHG